MAIVILEIRELAKNGRIVELRDAAQEAEDKLVEYYCKSAYSKPVVMATVCDPRYRFDYFTWAKAYNVTGQDEDIREKAYKTGYEEFTKYFEKRTGCQAVQGTKNVSIHEERS
jgi:hypothetical protein